MVFQQLPKSLLHFLWYFVSKQPFAFLVFLISPFAIVLKTNVVPYALKLIIDTLADCASDRNTIFDSLEFAIWIGSSAWLGLIVVEWVNYIIQVKSIPQFEANMRIEVISYALSHSYEFFSNNLSGNIVNKIMALINSIAAIRKIITLNIISAGAVIGTAIILLYTVKPVFSLIILVWVTLQTTATFYFVKRINKISIKNAAHKSNISGLIVDTILNMASVKLFARESYELAFIKKQQDIEKTSNAQLIRIINWFYVSIDIFVTIVLVITFYLLIKGWQQHTLTSGDLVFVFYMIFAVMNQTRQLGYALADFFKEAGIAQESLSIIVKKPNMVDQINSKSLKVKKGQIIFKNVSFSYIGDKILFKKLNLIIYSGQKVGIVGYSGSGKSSFINLLLRFYDVQEGKILIDNQDIAQVSQRSLRQSIAVILQDTNLFHRSLFDNIAYGNINASWSEVCLAAKRAYCDDFIREMPESYETLVGERGTKLSGGQRQRIAIARAILKKAPIVVLDEATSSLDSNTESLIQKSLENLIKKKTVIVIAHRLSTLTKMDRILVFDKGNIIEDGNHQDLLVLGRVYADMWKKQVNGFLPT